MYKDKYYACSPALHMLCRTLINSQVQYRIAAWGKAVPSIIIYSQFQLVLTGAMRCLNIPELGLIMLPAFIKSVLKWASSCMMQ